MATPGVGLTAAVRVKANRLPAIGSSARRTLGQAVRAAGFRAQAEAQRNAPVDTGYHRSRIHVAPGASDLETVVASGSGYGLELERGTRRMAARPHVEPAVRAQLPQLERDVAEAMRP